MSSPIFSAIKQICDEKGLTVESVVATIEAALAAAFRKDFGSKNQNIKVEFDPKTGSSRVFDVKIVAEDPEEEDIEELSDDEEAAEGRSAVERKTREESKEAIEKKGDGENEEDEEKIKFNPKLNIAISEAKKIKKNSDIGDEIKMELEVPDDYGRMAAQTAKQVIMQKLREVERQTVFNDFKDKEHEILGGIIQRREGKLVLVDLGRTTALMLPEDQVRGENYRPGARFKFYLKSVEMGSKGPEILVSRTHSDIVRRLFEVEIPEIASGSIEIKSIAREAGARTKVAVEAKDENIDPIGSCVGQRGTRVQTIISELGGEKIDIIEWDEDSKKFIANSLSPAKVLRIDLNEKDNSALAVVKSDQLSLAIGKGGQNVRLAAKLSGWKIDVAEEKGDGEAEKVEIEKIENVEEDTKEEKKGDKKAILKKDDAAGIEKNEGIENNSDIKNNKEEK